MILKRARIGGCVAWLVAAGAVSGAAAQPAVTELRPSVDGGARLRLSEILRLGSVDGEHDAFGRVSAAAFGGSGRIYVLDALSHRVSVFEAGGRFVGRFGRRGNGPGEFSRPWAMAVDGRDSAFVWDGDHGRISVFGPDLAFARAFAFPVGWQVTAMEALTDGHLLVSAYGPGASRAVHLLDRGGALLRSFGPEIAPQDVAGFESSLLGGAATFAEATVAYVNKSPYEISYTDLQGRERARCRARGVTTDPQSVVVRRDDGVGLQWSRFVHASGIIALGADLHLVMIHDPVEGRTLLDVVGPGCRLLRRSSLPGTASIEDRRGSRLLVARGADVPQVVVYTFTVDHGAHSSPSPPRSP